MTSLQSNPRFHADPSGMEPVAALNEVRFLDPAVQEHPSPFYRALRHQAPVYFDETINAYLVARYDDLQTVMRDPVTFSMEKGYYSQMARGYFDELKAILIRDGGGWFPDVVNIDPPRHNRARMLVGQSFTARRIAALQTTFEHQVDALLDAIAARGEMDGLADLAVPMAIGFSTGQLNVHDLHHETIQRWGAAFLSQFSMLDGPDHVQAIASDLSEMQRYLIDLVRARMDDPGEDMLSDLVRARMDDEKPQLDFAELVASARALLINTHDSVSTAMSNVLFAVATDAKIADAFYAAEDDPDQMARIIEEILRLEPPVRAMSRVTTSAVELGGVALPEGAHLLLLFASGNDDESTFSQAREFDPNRRNLVRNVTFGAGRHMCLGIVLARMQLRVAASKVAQRFKNLRLAIPVADIRYHANVALLSMEALPLRFDPLAHGAASK